MAESYVSCMFHKKKKKKLSNFFTKFISFKILPGVYPYSFVPYPCQHLVGSDFLILDILTKCVKLSKSGFSLYFLNNCWC